MATEHCLIVGAGQAGLRTALGLRDAGFCGRVTLAGDEPQLPYERPPLSKQVLLNGADPLVGQLTTLQQLQQAGIELLAGDRAATLEPGRRRVRFASGVRLAFDQLVIATGARARRMALSGSDLPGVYSLRSAADAAALREQLRPDARVVLIGGGFIGLEVAASAVQLGCRVTVLEAERRLLGRALSEPLSRYLLALHEGRGVEVRLGVAVVALAGDAWVKGVQVSGEVVPADVVVIGVGAEPNCDWLQGSGLELQGGVVVDERCQSSVANIYAIGDVAQGRNRYLGRQARTESWHNAEVQAAVAAQAICGIDAVHDCVPWFWTDQYDMNLQMLGLPSPTAQRVCRVFADNRSLVEFAVEEGVLTGATLVNQGKLRRIVEAALAARVRPDCAGLGDAGRDLRELLRGQPADILVAGTA